MLPLISFHRKLLSVNKYDSRQQPLFIRVNLSLFYFVLELMFGSKF